MTVRSTFKVPALTPMRILVADDNDANCLIAKTILERAGHRIVMASNGAHALNLSKIATYDLIILDIMMPVMNGLEALKRIKAEESYNKNTPIFALTAYCDFEDRQRYASAGFDAILAKPLRPGDLETAFVRYRDRDPPLRKELDGAAVANHIPLMDEEMISLLRSCGSPERLMKIQSRFWASMHIKCIAIKASLPAALRGDDINLSELRRAVHAVKGACASIGLARVAHISQNLRNAPPAEIPELMRALVTALSESRPALSQALSGTRQFDTAVQMRRQDETEAPHHSQNNRSAIGN